MEKWSELRTALFVARLGTVSASAQALGFHRATVNRHIDVLEAEIGARIFIRHARGYTLTEIGHEVLRVAQKAEEMIDDLAGRVRGGQSEVTGEIKLTLLAPFALLLMDAINRFRAENPHCRVELDASEDLARLEYGEAHIAVRAGPKPENPDYVVGSFGTVSFNLYAHDSYIQRCGLPHDFKNLPGHSFIVPHIQDDRLPFQAWIRDHVSEDMIALRTSNLPSLVEAVSKGLGMGFLGDEEARYRGNLHAMLPANTEWTVPGWLVTHVDLHRTEKVQAMLRCIKASRRV